jgi:hypothetical protein
VSDKNPKSDCIAEHEQSAEDFDACLAAKSVKIVDCGYQQSSLIQFGGLDVFGIKHTWFHVDRKFP